jgi:hypothetical protein
VRQAILDAMQVISRHPYIGIKNARLHELRSKLVLRYPYRVHYLLQGQEIWIVHIPPHSPASVARRFRLTLDYILG